MDDAAKQAVEASAALKEHAQVRETLIHEKEKLEARVEKTETKLVQVNFSISAAPALALFLPAYACPAHLVSGP